MPNYRLIAMDLDGTLLNNQKRVSEQAKKFLLKCKKDGYVLVCATGRNLESVKSVIPLDLFDYYLLNNGTHFYDSKKDTGCFIKYLNRKTIENIVQDFKQEASQIDLCSTSIYYHFFGKTPSLSSFQHNITSLSEVREEILKMNIMLNQSNHSKVREKILKDYPDTDCFIMQDSESKARWLCILPKGINKGSSLEWLGKRLEIPVKQMIYFGDSPNDIEAISVVGCGVAMGNAVDCVKEYADIITLSNEEDGVIYQLKKMLP